MENHTKSYSWLYFILIIIIGAAFNSYKTSINEKIDELEHYIGCLEDDLSEATSKIEELETNIDEIKYKLNIY